MTNEIKEQAQLLLKRSNRWIWINIIMGIGNIWFVLIVPQPIILKVFLLILAIGFFGLAQRHFKIKQKLIRIIDTLDKLERMKVE